MAPPKNHGGYPDCGRPRTYTDEFIEKEAAAFREWIKQKGNIWFKDFARERGYHSKCFPLWAARNESFKEAYDIVNDWQESIIVKGGLLKKFSSGLSKFLLINNHGYMERQQVTVNDGDTMSDLLLKIDGATKELVDESGEDD